MLRSTVDPLGRVADSAFPSEKEEPESGLDYLEGDSRGDLLESWPLENSLVCGFTGHCGHFCWPAARRKGTGQG